MNQEPIPVYLKPEEAALFILFMKHYDKIGFMFKEGVFDTRNGSAELHFNPQGDLHSIRKVETKYAPKFMVIL